MSFSEKVQKALHKYSGAENTCVIFKEDTLGLLKRELRKLQALRSAAPATFNRYVELEFFSAFHDDANVTFDSSSANRLVIVHDEKYGHFADIVLNGEPIEAQVKSWTLRFLFSENGVPVPEPAFESKDSLYLALLSCRSWLARIRETQRPKVTYAIYSYDHVGWYDGVNGRFVAHRTELCEYDVHVEANNAACDLLKQVGLSTQLKVLSSDQKP